jgi:hypothetical protein
MRRAEGLDGLDDPRAAAGAGRRAVDPIAANVELLRRTLALVEGLTEVQYTHVEVRLGSASIGAHVRHLLEHYRLFLDGLPAGEIDYDARRRDTEVERSGPAAVAEARSLIAALAALAALPVPPAQGADWTRQPLRVRQQGDEIGRSGGCESQVLRELLFLQCHAVHHQALIAVLARAQGLAVPDTFGLAPSTATWQRTHALPEDRACAR